MIRDNRILLCKPYAFPYLIVPGGIKEGEEDFITNLTRETIEELGEGASLNINSLEYIGRFEDVAAGRTDIIVEIDLYKGEVGGVLCASSEISELIWYHPLEGGNLLLSAIVENKIIPYAKSTGLLTW